MSLLHYYALSFVLFNFHTSSWELLFMKGNNPLSDIELKCCYRFVDLCKEALFIVYRYSNDEKFQKQRQLNSHVTLMIKSWYTCLIYINVFDWRGFALIFINEKGINDSHSLSYYTWLKAFLTECLLINNIDLFNLDSYLEKCFFLYNVDVSTFTMSCLKVLWYSQVYGISRSVI